MGFARNLREAIDWDVPAPPWRVRRLLRQERGFHARRAEFSEDWLPFPILILPLLFVLAAGSAVLFPGFLASAAWLASAGDTVCDPKNFNYDYGDDVCRWAAERVTVDEVRELPGFIAVVAWLGTVFALAVGLGFLLTHVRSAAHRRSTWRDSLWYEYVSWRDGRRERTWGGVADLSWLRWLVRLLWKTRTGQPEDRLTHARRWAWANEAVAQASVIGLVVFGAVCAALLMWRSGTLAAERPVLWHDAAAAAGEDLAWNLARSIPVLEITDTMHWRRPTLFADDTTWSVLLLLVKVAVFLPVLAYVIDLVRQRRDDSVPASPFADEPVVGAVRGVLDDAPLRFIYYHWGLAWPLLYAAAALRLNKGPVPPPEGSDGWTPRLVAEELPKALREPG